MAEKSDYEKLSAFILEQQRPQPLLVIPVFEFYSGPEGPEAPRYTGLWQDDRGRRYRWENLPPEAIYQAVGLDDEVS